MTVVFKCQAAPTQKIDHSARLIARRTAPKVGRRHAYLYDVEIDGKRIVQRSSEPGLDLARVLRANGLSGLVAIVDERGLHRYTIDIDVAAQLTVRETAGEGPKFVKWKALARGDGPHQSAKEPAP